MTDEVGRMDGMGDLAEFLLARIADDEAVAGSLLFETGTEGVSDVRSPLWEAQQFSVSVRGFAERWTPARVLAECEAKRRIVEWFSGSDPDEQPVMHMLALPYADHPDFRSEWRA